LTAATFGPARWQISRTAKPPLNPRWQKLLPRLPAGAAACRLGNIHANIWLHGSETHFKRDLKHLFEMSLQKLHPTGPRLLEPLQIHAGRPAARVAHNAGCIRIKAACDRKIAPSFSPLAQVCSIFSVLWPSASAAITGSKTQPGSRAAVYGELTVKPSTSIRPARQIPPAKNRQQASSFDIMKQSVVPRHCSIAPATKSASSPTSPIGVRAPSYAAARPHRNQNL